MSPRQAARRELAERAARAQQGLPGAGQRDVVVEQLEAVLGIPEEQVDHGAIGLEQQAVGVARDAQARPRELRVLGLAEQAERAAAEEARRHEALRGRELSHAQLEADAAIA